MPISVDTMLVTGTAILTATLVAALSSHFGAPLMVASFIGIVTGLVVDRVGRRLLERRTVGS